MPNFEKQKYTGNSFSLGLVAKCLISPIAGYFFKTDYFHNESAVENNTL